MGAGYLVGVDLGGTKIHTALADESGQVLAEVKTPTQASGGPEQVIGRIIATVEQVREQAGVAAEAVIGVGVGSPGPLNPKTGVVHFSPNLKWRNVPLKKLLEEGLGLRVVLDKDANAAALGEHLYGAGQGTTNMIYLTVSTGVGGGLILNGKLYHGSGYGAGELGHMKVLPNGPLCGCGARGCLEAVASGTAIAREARELIKAGGGREILRQSGGNIADISAIAVSAAAAAGDKEAAAIIKRAAMFLGIGIANLINIFNPELIVLGGGVMEIGDPVWHTLRREVATHALQTPKEQARIVPAGLGQRSGVLGAIGLLRL